MLIKLGISPLMKPKNMSVFLIYLVALPNDVVAVDLH
jgi:hypothetical protein